jgi:excisionase family DNA binding protein/putative nucleotidyltransferase with HDIG domain
MKSKTANPASLVNTKEAADLLGVTAQTIKNYIYAGKLKSYKSLGGHHRLKVLDLEELAPQKSDFSREELLEQYDQFYRDYVDTIEALLNAVDGRDGIISGHSRRVADYACVIGGAMGLSPESLRVLELAALLHDVGKIMISEQILGKPGKLTDQETYMIRQHAELGERIVGDIKYLREIAPFIRHHHERFDGQGYPDGLSGENIPPEARIIFIGEVFDALTSDTSYHSTMDLKEALVEMERGANTQFDPEILRIFLDNISQDPALKG